MASLNLTIDLPADVRLIDTSLLKSQLTAFAKILLSTMPQRHGKEDVSLANPFVEMETLRFPSIPKEFQPSEELRNIGVDFPEDFDYDSIKDEMYHKFAK